FPLLGFELCHSEDFLHPHRCTRLFLSYFLGREWVGGCVGGFWSRSSIFNYYYSGVGGTHAPTHPLPCWRGVPWFSKINFFSAFAGNCSLYHTVGGWVRGWD